MAAAASNMTGEARTRSTRCAEDVEKPLDDGAQPALAEKPSPKISQPA
jgi:hypothetical protein